LPWFNKASVALARALTLNPKDADSLVAMAELHQEQAEWKFKQGDLTQEYIEKGLTMVDKALAVKPKVASTIALQATLTLLKAQSAQDKVMRNQLAQKSQILVKQALEINPTLQKELQAKLAKIGQLSK
jgi:hypothetical protein